MRRIEDAAIYSTLFKEAKTSLIKSPLNFATRISTDWHYGERRPQYENEVVELTHTQMSASDFGFVDSIVQQRPVEITMDTARQSLQACAGSEINYITSEMTRDFISHELDKTAKKITSIRSNRHLKKHEPDIYDRCLDKVLGDTAIEFREIPDAAYEVWKALKREYVFYQRPPNSKHIPMHGGSKYSSEWVAIIWSFDQEQEIFEEAIAGIHSIRNRRYIDQDLFSDERIMLPLKCMVQYPLEIDRPMHFQIDHGPFKTQYQGKLNMVLNKNIIISPHFVSTESISSLSNRLKVLISCLGVKGNGHNWRLENLDVSDVTYLYQVYDHKKTDVYYIDASIGGEEMSYLTEQLFLYSANWQCIKKDEDYEDLRKIYDDLERALVLPHLPDEVDLDKLQKNEIDFQ